MKKDQHGNLYNHLKDHHEDVYIENKGKSSAVTKKKSCEESGNVRIETAPLTNGSFRTALTKFIASTNQSFSIVEQQPLISLLQLVSKKSNPYENSKKDYNDYNYLEQVRRSEVKFN